MAFAAKKICADKFYQHIFIRIIVFVFYYMTINALKVDVFAFWTFIAFFMFIFYYLKFFFIMTVITFSSELALMDVTMTVYAFDFMKQVTVFRVANMTFKKRMFIIKRPSC